MNTINRRIAAQIEGDVVVFLIGARINRGGKLPLHLGAHATAQGRLGQTDGTDAPISPAGDPG
jgi:hypothetical protein